MEKTLVKKWFMIHTYSGYEKKVKTDLEQKIETLGIGEIVTKVLVPEEETIEEVRGKKKTVARKIFPGYVMLEMVATREESEDGINFRVDSNAWYVVRNTNGVTGFVGVGSDPIPMEDDEVANIFRVIGYDIPEEEKERVFERFYRVDKSHSRENGGTGLGLSIVKHGALLHDAKIQISSNLGKGTKIELIFGGDSRKETDSENDR